MEVLEEKVGTQHPDTILCLDNLAFLYAKQKKYEQAEALVLRILHVREQELGVDHPGTASWFNNVAIIYFGQRKYEQAETLFKKALNIYEQELGTTDPNVIQIAKTYVSLLKSMQRTEEVEVVENRYGITSVASDANKQGF